MQFIYPRGGATPLDHDELAHLIPKHITTQHDLNAWEENNILIAHDWAFKQKEIFSDMIKQLHRKIFYQTWKWAGQFRKTEKNMGIAWSNIPLAIKNLCDDIHYQIEYKVFSSDEIAIRFHHRLTLIHAFPNGNGRHARLMANILITLLGNPKFTWGMNQNLYESSIIREQYINALQAADKSNYELF